MEKGTTIKGEQNKKLDAVGEEDDLKEKQNNILDLYQKIDELKNKLSFLTSAMIRILEEEGFGEEVVSGYQLIMYSLEDELKEIDSMLEMTLLGKHRRFESAETRIKHSFWKSVNEINEDVNTVKTYIEHINKLKVRAEDALERGERLLQRYQTA